MKPRYLIQVNMNEEEYLKFLRLLKLSNLGKTALIKSALFEPEKLTEFRGKMKGRES